MTNKGDNILGPARAGETHALPLRKARTRPQMPLSRVLERLAEPSPELEDAGIVPAALEAGLKIRLARLEQGLTQSELARMAGISQPALSNIEQGRGSDGPSYGTLRQITQALGIELFPAPAREERVELSLTAPATERAAAADDADSLPNAESLEVGNAYRLVETLVDGRLRIKIREFLKERGEHRGSRSNPAAYLYSLDPNRTAHIDVAPKTALMVHGAAGFVSASGGRNAGVELVRGTGGQVAMVGRSGRLTMQNNRSESVLVFAIPTQTLLME